MILIGVIAACVDGLIVFSGTKRAALTAIEDIKFLAANKVSLLSNFEQIGEILSEADPALHEWRHLLIFGARLTSAEYSHSSWVLLVKERAAEDPLR